VPKDAQEEFLDQVIEKSESLEQKAPERYWIVHSPNILHSLTCLKDQSLVSFRYAISWTCHWGWFMNPLTFSMLFLPVSMDIYVMCVWMCFLLLVIVMIVCSVWWPADYGVFLDSVEEPLLPEVKEERTRRSQFVQGLVLSLMFDDILWRLSC
jgi:hypothetical protein